MTMPMLENPMNSASPRASPSASTPIPHASVATIQARHAGRATIARQSRLSVTARQAIHIALPVMTSR